MMKQKLFREDLFFRLSVYNIHMPPLRERPEDILLLSEHFLQHFSRKFGKRFQSINPDAIEALRDHQWRGNVRELRNLFERTVLSEDEEALKKQHLFVSTPPFAQEESEGFFQLPQQGVDLEQLEKNLI